MALLRSVFLAGAFATLAVAAMPAQAQSQRAYAPEALWTLGVSDQQRVIAQEYREQSSGRSIPDDQMRFYLDQVRLSRWTFSQVRSDIATSLRGSGGWRPPGPNPGTGNNIRCESNDGRARTCATQWQGASRLVKQLSSARCTEGQTWNSGRGFVTVNQGCRGEFAPGIGNGHGSETVQCESNDGRYRTCGSNLRGQISVQRQISSTRCVEGSNFGLRNGSVWVDRGCRGVFLVQRGNGNGNRPPLPAYTVTCSSERDRYTTCAWDANRGVPRLLQTLSSSACVEGRSWGYSLRTGLWVNNGCRARFGTR